ncbi:YqaJ viral recombinase family nuclease [Caldimonas taiwanensis]|uniref:YqaJ viral recombinase family nuclease n=1 Tax=Caldimonas taiwanensis TaxID=307483 RepID=UPI000781E932|nr:YqaJ viral recombinase family protein [Caldimonas taiwanensis]
MNAAADRAEWLAERRSGIGGSDIAAILGLSPWKTAVDVWLEKTGRSTDDTIGDAEAVRWGALLEDVVAREYAERTEHNIQRVNRILRHPSHEWAIGNIDRAIVAPGSRVRVADDGGTLLGADGLLEVKTASAYKAGEWGRDGDDDAVPLHYQAQCMWYLGITGQPWCDVAALIGGQRLVIRRIHRDDETIAAMLERADDFWHRHVLGGQAPEPATARDVETLFRSDNGEALEADDELLAAYSAARAAKNDMAYAEARYEEAVERIKLALGERSALTFNGQPLATWKATKPARRTDWKALVHHHWPVPPAELVEQFTTETPGSRRFLLKE